MDNFTNATNLHKMSMDYLQRQLPFNCVVYFVLAPITVLTNCFTIYILHKGRNFLRSHHYCLLRHMITVSTVFVLNSIFFIGIRRLYLTLSNTSEVGTKLKCSLLFLTYEILTAVDFLNVMVVAGDRLFAVAFPIQYNKYQQEYFYKVGTCLTQWVISVTAIFSKYLLYTKEFAATITSNCILTNTRTKKQNVAFYSFSIFICCTTVALYGAAVIVVLYKMKKHKGNVVKTMRKRLGLRMIVCSAVDGTIYAFCYFASIVFVAVVLVRAKIVVQMALGPIVFGFYLISFPIRLFILYYLNQDFRNFCRLNFKVHKINQ